MSEVNRFLAGDIFEGAEVVYAEDFDRLTAERDAALGREAALIDQLDAALRQVKANWDYAQDKQQRLTAAYERAAGLEGLLRDVSGRGRVVRWELGLMDQIDDALKGFCPSCNGAGWANQGCVDLCVNCNGSGMAALKPAEAPINQCDGCQAGIPVVNGAPRGDAVIATLWFAYVFIYKGPRP